MRNIILIALVFIFSSLQSENEIDILGKYIQTNENGTTSNIVFSPDSTFHSTLNGEISNIVNQGYFEIIDKNVFLTYNKPSISNKIDTFLLENHYQKRRDTLWVINENIISQSPKKVHDGYYQYEKYDPQGNKCILKDWKVIDTTIVSIDENGLKNVNVIKNYHVATGVWKYFDKNGRLVKELQK